MVKLEIRVVGIETADMAEVTTTTKRTIQGEAARTVPMTIREAVAGTLTE